MVKKLRFDDTEVFHDLYGVFEQPEGLTDIQPVASICWGVEEVVKG